MQLFQFVGGASQGAIELGELLSSRNHRRRPRDRGFKRFDRLGKPPLVAQAETEQVVGVRQSIAEAEGLRERRERGIDVAIAVTREREPVRHVLGPVVEVEAALVHVGGALETLPAVEDIAEGFERPRG